MKIWQWKCNKCFAVLICVNWLLENGLFPVKFCLVWLRWKKEIWWYQISQCSERHNFHSWYKWAAFCIIAWTEWNWLHFDQFGGLRYKVNYWLANSTWHVELESPDMFENLPRLPMGRGGMFICSKLGQNLS